MVTFLLFLRGCLLQIVHSSLTSSTQFTEQIYSTKAHNKHQTSPAQPQGPHHPCTLHTTYICIGKLVVEELPLEYYHSPVWWKLSLAMHMVVTIYKRVLAEKNTGRTPTRQAKKLRERFSDNEGEEDASTTIRHGNGSVERVLKMAAESIGRSDLDAIYVTSLQEDLYLY